jgi:biotin carboxyl carrier protein
MRLTLRHGSRHVALDVEADGQRYRVSIDGREYGVEARYLDDATLLLDVDGRRAIVHLACLGHERAVAVRGETYRLASESAAAAHTGVAAVAEPRVRAPMPGKVLQVLVAPGDRVEAGDGLLILEAMKMENRLTADAPGVVEDVQVAAGDMVDGGQVLLVVRYGDADGGGQ